MQVFFQRLIKCREKSDCNLFHSADHSRSRFVADPSETKTRVTGTNVHALTWWTEQWMDGLPYPLSHCKSTARESVSKKKKKSPPMLPPPAPIMTVNFHPLLQNGCLMINRGSELRSRSHAASAHTQARVTVKRATPPSVLLRNGVLKRSLFSWVMDHRRSLWEGCVNLSVCAGLPAGGAVGRPWWMCPGSLGFIYQKISTDLWVVWALPGASSPPALPGISIRGHGSVSGGYKDSVLYLVLSKYRSQEVCR